MSLLPLLNEIDFGTTPARTNKSIMLRVKGLDNNVRYQGHNSGSPLKFTQEVHVEIYVRDATAPGRRQGREPEKLVAMEKYLVDFLAINRLALQDVLGIQYAEIIGTQTFSEIEAGAEEAPAPYYHCIIKVRLHYWMRFSEESTLD